VKLTDLEASGLVPLETSPSLLANIARVRNEVSIHARTDPLTTPRPAGEGEGIVDRYYGHVYDRWLLEERLAPYGLVNDLFPYEIDRLANHGFLRVPFRRIPRRVVRDQDELAAIVALLGSVNPDIHVAFRGQNREYLVPRRPEGRDALYGDPRALEPSLLPSSARAGISFEATLPEWFAVVNLSMHEARRHVMDVASAEHVAMMQDEHERLRTSFRLYLHGMAIAQHYGLPSTGLDLTDSIATAVFFALHEFHPTANPTVLQCARRRDDELAVLYVFEIPTRFQLIFEQARPKGFPAARPDRQRAHFLHGGWGLSANDAACFLCLALYLDPRGDFSIPSAEDVFPSADEDWLGEWLMAVKERLERGRLADFMSGLYWVIGA
jgi:hypothetical protein